MIRACLTALAAGCLAVPATVGAATASATIEDILIRVFDLNPSDGNAAQVTWLTAQTVVQVSGQNAPLAQTFNDTGVSQTFMAQISRAGSRNAVSAQAGVGSSTISASGSALAPFTEFQATANTGQTSFNTGLIGPGTQLIFTATAFVNVAAFDFCAQNNFQFCDLAQAGVRLETQSSLFGGTTLQTASASVNGATPYQNDVIGDSRSYQFNWVLNNPGTTAVPFQFLLSADAYAREFSTNAAPIPELPTGASLLLGLGWLVHRNLRSRRSKA